MNAIQNSCTPESDESRIYTELRRCCGEPFNLVNLRRVSLLLTQFHWSHSKNHGDLETQLGCLVYRPSDPASSLQVRLDSDFKEDEAFQDSSIYVGLDRVAFTKQMQDARVGEHDDFGGRDYSWGSASTVRVAHYHPDADVALLMGDSTMTFFLGIRPDIMGRLGLDSMDPIDVGPLQVIEKSPQRCYRVDAKLRVTYPTNVTVFIEGHRLKQFLISADPV